MKVKGHTCVWFGGFTILTELFTFITSVYFWFGFIKWFLCITSIFAVLVLPVWFIAVTGLWFLEFTITKWFTLPVRFRVKTALVCITGILVVLILTIRWWWLVLPIWFVIARVRLFKSTVTGEFLITKGFVTKGFLITKGFLPLWSAITITREWLLLPIRLVTAWEWLLLPVRLVTAWEWFFFPIWFVAREGLSFALVITHLVQVWVVNDQKEGENGNAKKPCEWTGDKIKKMMG